MLIEKNFRLMRGRMASEEGLGTWLCTAALVLVSRMYRTPGPCSYTSLVFHDTEFFESEWTAHLFNPVPNTVEPKQKQKTKLEHWQLSVNIVVPSKINRICADFCWHVWAWYMLVHEITLLKRGREDHETLKVGRNSGWTVMRLLKMSPSKLSVSKWAWEVFSH